MLIEKSNLNIERTLVANIENKALKILEFRIPNFSIRHFLEALLCVGMATTEDKVFSFEDEKDKKLVCEKFIESHPNDVQLLKDQYFRDVSAYEKVFSKVQRINEKLSR